MKSVILNGQTITIGSKIRFIDDRDLYTQATAQINKPKLGEIYTVRSFAKNGSFLLEEVKNEEFQFEIPSFFGEPGFAIRRFEPTQPIKKKKIVQIEILPMVEERLEIPIKKRKFVSMKNIFQS